MGNFQGPTSEPVSWGGGGGGGGGEGEHDSTGNIIFPTPRKTVLYECPCRCIFSERKKIAVTRELASGHLCLHGVSYVLCMSSLIPFGSKHHFSHSSQGIVPRLPTCTLVTPAGFFCTLLAFTCTRGAGINRMPLIYYMYVHVYGDNAVI